MNVITPNFQDKVKHYKVKYKDGTIEMVRANWFGFQTGIPFVFFFFYSEKEEETSPHVAIDYNTISSITEIKNVQYN
jgi:hypothetical protein